MAKRKKNTNKGMKVTTVNFSKKQLKFFDQLKETGLIPSRSEAVRFCVNIAIPYFKKMLEFLDESVTDELINKIKELQENVAIDNFHKLKLEQQGTWIAVPKSLPKNIYWEQRFINGKWVNVPVEKESNEEMIFTNEYGYVPISRLEDLEIPEEQKLKILVQGTMNSKKKKKKPKILQKNPYNNIIANSGMNKYKFQGGR